MASKYKLHFKITVVIYFILFYNITVFGEHETFPNLFRKHLKVIRNEALMLQVHKLLQSICVIHDMNINNLLIIAA